MEKLFEEILRDIFMIATLSALRDDRSTSFLAPLRITHTCSRWRNVALSFGNMWSYLHIDVQLFFRCESATVEIFDSWLQRTNGQPLNFTLVLGQCVRLAEWTPMAAHMVSEMMKERQRWREVSLLWCLLDSPPKIEAENMPQLLSLHLAYGGLAAFNANLEPATIDISASRNIRKLTIDYPHQLSSGTAPVSALTGWSGLKRLSVVIPSGDRLFSEWWNILEKAANLKHIQFSFRKEAGTVIPEDLKMIDLPHLEFFSVQETEDHYRIWDKLTLPALLVLACNYLGPPGSDIFLNFIRRSMPPLTFLIVRGAETTHGELISALRLLPTLESLFINFSTGPVTLFQELTVPSVDRFNKGEGIRRNDVLCPALRTFRFEKFSEEDTIEATVNAFSTMIMSRQQRMKTFTVVELNEKVEMLQLPLTEGHPGYEEVQKVMGKHQITLRNDNSDPFEGLLSSWDDD